MLKAYGNDHKGATLQKECREFVRKIFQYKRSTNNKQESPIIPLKRKRFRPNIRIAKLPDLEETEESDSAEILKLMPNSNNRQDNDEELKSQYSPCYQDL